LALCFAGRTSQFWAACFASFAGRARLVYPCQYPDPCHKSPEHKGESIGAAEEASPRVTVKKAANVAGAQCVLVRVQRRSWPG
jgi:hypothetical protein